MSPAAAAAGGGERRRPIASGRDGRGRCCGGAAGAVLVGLSLLGLVLYLVPAVAALAWLAVGATAAWWGLSAEPRGSRAFSLGRHARRPRAPLASTPAKAAVNGNLLEPRSLLEGPDRAELLLMGSYLGKPGPPSPAATSEARELRERPGLRPPARAAPPAHHLLPARPAPLRLVRRPPPRDCGTLSNRFVITPRRHYPIQQAQYSLLGALPTVCWNGYHKKAVLSPRNSKMVCSPVTVRIAPPDSKLARSSLPEQVISSPLSSPPSNAPDPCAKETVLNALRERKKRSVEEEDQLFTNGQENKRRRHDSSGSGHSAFEPLVANGVPATFVPKPGSLKRGLVAQSADDHLNKRSRTSSLSSLASTCTGGIPSSSRNAITSSYSSTRGHTQLWKRTGPSSSPFSSPASSRSQTPERPAKKMREEELTQPSSSTPLVTDKETQGEKVADPAVPKKQSSFSSPTTPSGSGQRKRKIQLLPSRRGDQLTLPPPPQLGYSVTAEDLDLEKKASLQWFNKVLEDQTDAASGSVPESPPAPLVTLSLKLPVTEAAPPTAPLPEPSTNPNPLLESLKKMQGSPGLPTSSGAATVATSETSSPPKTLSLMAPLAAPPQAPFPSISEDSKPSVTFLGLTPTSSTIPITETTKVPVTSQAETAAAPNPAPKQSILFGMLSTPSSSSPAPAAPGVSPAALTFKPIFETPPKSEMEVPLSTSPPKAASAAPATSSSSAPPTTTASSPTTFKPTFDSLAQPPSVPLLSPFSFVPTPAATTTSTTTSTPLFTGQASTASSAATVATVSTTAATATKPLFGFTVGTVTGTSNSSNSSSSTTTTTATTTTAAATTTSSQPFLFGTPSASTASFPPSLGSIFQFGQSPAVPPATTAATFGQSLATVAPSSSSSGFTGFSSVLSTAPATSSAAPTTFNIPFGSSTKAPLPSYPAANPQPTFGATDGSSQGAGKPVLAPSFGSSFTFGNSAAPAPTAAPAPAPTPAQSTFDSTTQYTFGSLKPTASAFGTTTTTQPAFGSTTSVFSFGAATTQTPSSGASSSLFGSTTPSPFTFGGSTASGSFGLSVATTSSTSGAFSFGTGQSGSTTGTTPFGAGLSQNPLAAPSQSTPFAFSVSSTPESKPVFGGTSTPTFGQNNPGPGVGATGSSLPFGASPTPAQGFVGVGPFGSAAPSFSIGAGSKTPGARQRLQARRQHTRKK